MQRQDRKKATQKRIVSPTFSRRRFVTGLAASTSLSLLYGCAPSSRMLKNLATASSPIDLPGNNFALDIGYSAVNFTGSMRQATTVNGSLPAPTLRWKEGDRVTLNVNNDLAMDSSIHWHGIILPTGMDGVPGMSFAGIKPGETFQYQFDVNQSGTYWYHSHSGFQEQTGLYGAIVIEPQKPSPYHYDRDFVVLLSDWSDQSPDQIYADLKRLPHIYNNDERTLTDWRREVAAKGAKAVHADRAMWNHMRMSDRDISDVTGRTYTYLMNGITPAEGWVGEFNKGEKILLRIINGSAMSFFDVRIPGLKMTVVAADGQDVQAVTVDEFRIGTAETYDVIVEPKDDRAYTLFCQSIDRSGYARGTLTPNRELVSKIPEMDESPILSHADMGMSHGSSMGECTPEHAAMGHCEMPQDASPACTPEHAAMGHCEMPKNDPPACTPEHAAMGHCEMPKDTPPACTPEHAAMGHCEMPKQVQEFSSGLAGYGTKKPVSHSGIVMGPHIDMLADSAVYRLDDPGVGLRDNGRRVLTYADLFNHNPTPDPREPEREIELHLTGNMSRYMWSIDGIKAKNADPIMMRFGERVRITLVNDTMMNHPIHLHGVWSDLETGDGAYIPRKHTVIVQPGSKISYLVNADARGKWAYHCHLLYHMLGMFREVHIT